MSGEEMADMTARVSLEDLTDIVAERGRADPSQSYTAKLLAKGVGEVAKKLGEEGVELALAAVSGPRERVIAETADLLYHLAVLLAAREVSLAEVEVELAKRTGRSGLAEKASRVKE
ncbi:phosphoribosyl-ATP diphosphatase [Blastochloris tepida]|uniref:Phosphoribosyl-ATP pyrophosphatase n=1 Tax=Blastochloris tepida TaxID=2233851 RepID=A0A348G4R5_9HYPH|nr:phosphoribosyl-ATP diphosphatase [Blastochloris tepida]BBF94548.1 phosphoribosyl-ATP pyrophosphatase [Blastochloris tepida]